MKFLVDEDTLSAALIARLIASGHEVVQLPLGTPDAVIFDEAQRLAIPILTANVGRKGRRDPVGLDRLPGACAATVVSSASSGWVQRISFLRG